MGINFYPVWTQDGSIGLFNEEVEDIYHSACGAYTESIQKFILPSGLIDKLQHKTSIKILDICFGMGYNSKTSIENFLENNYKGEVIIDALEMDRNVIAFSFLCKNQPYNFDFLDYVDFRLFDDKKMLDSIFSIIENPKFVEFLDEEKTEFFKSNQNTLYKYNGVSKLEASLHNIYYTYISNRNIRNDKHLKKHPKIDLRVYLGDARGQIANIQGKYDCIYLDAFSPPKLPTLWSVEFFKALYGLLKDDGNIVTYSSSTIIRAGMVEAGFFIGKTQHGTIANKNPDSILTPLDQKSLGLLQTKAGIPFYDKNLSSTKEEILCLRKSMMQNSDRQNSSQFLKNFQKNKYRL